MKATDRIVRWGMAWVALAIAIALHVADEAVTDFLPLYNSIVESLLNSCFVTNTRDHDAKSASMYWWIGPATGVFLSVTVTVIVVIWEWIENPGGIFRSELGTNWQFVSDTAISWFVPTLVYVTVMVSVLHLAWHFVKKNRGRRFE